ncbi:putative RDD family membrane protein YckC [Streptacidiphilus sp. MAP12-20]|uniref:RDD family protein n=1 Tax=Streptacidiphilus sp. MAP12-20 TaxID=3156299 RepID=UPI003517D1D0
MDADMTYEPMSRPAEPTLASAGSRFGAFLLDSLLMVPLVLLGLLIPGTSIGSWTLVLVQSGIVLVYGGLMLAVRGQTLGMRALGIRVVPLNGGERPTAGQAWLRTAAAVLPTLLPLNVGDVWSLLDPAWLLWDKPNRQALHDKIARTVVIDTRARIL